MLLSILKVLEACTDLDITSLVYSFGILNRIGGLQKQRKEKELNWKGLDSEFIETLALEAVHPVRMENYSYSMLVNNLHGLSLLKLNKSEALNTLLSAITRDDILPR